MSLMPISLMVMVIVMVMVMVMVMVTTGTRVFLHVDREIGEEDGD